MKALIMLARATLAGLCGIISIGSVRAQEPIPAYAPTKNPTRPITTRDELKGFTYGDPLPVRGIILARGSFMSPYAGWQAVDLDARTLTLETTAVNGLPDGEREVMVIQRQRRSLGDSEIARVVGQANLVWNPPEPPPAVGFVADLACDVVLLDGHRCCVILGWAVLPPASCKRSMSSPRLAFPSS